MGKGRDRGARKPIKTITPTFVLPVKGKDLGHSAYVGNSPAQTQFFKGDHEAHEGSDIIFYSKLRGLPLRPYGRSMLRPYKFASFAFFAANFLLRLRRGPH